jgi:hypothetical protein
MMQRTAGNWRVERAVGTAFVVAPAARVERGEHYRVAVVGDMFIAAVQADARLLALAPELMDLALRLRCAAGNVEINQARVRALADDARKLLDRLDEEGGG